MSSENIKAKEVYEHLLRTLDKQEPDLAERIRNAVNQGKEEFTKEDFVKNEEIRVSRPLSDREALDVAIKILHTYFIEIPLIVDHIYKCEHFKNNIKLNIDFENEYTFQN